MTDHTDPRVTQAREALIASIDKYGDSWQGSGQQGQAWTNTIAALDAYVEAVQVEAAQMETQRIAAAQASETPAMADDTVTAATQRVWQWMRADSDFDIQGQHDKQRADLYALILAVRAAQPQDAPAPARPQAREALDMDTLKPCPFCGFEARIIEVEETDNRGGFVVCCTGCEASTKVWFPLKDDVTQILRDEWNKRAAALSDAQPQELSEWKYRAEQAESALVQNSHEYHARTLELEAAEQEIERALDFGHIHGRLGESKQAMIDKWFRKEA
jgi:Lar family restriction alleviation protein